MFSFSPSVALSRSQRTLGLGFHPLGTSGRGNLQGSTCVEGDFDSANDSPHALRNRFVRKFEPREYRFAIAKHAWTNRLYLEYVNMLPAPPNKGRNLPIMLGQSYY